MNIINRDTRINVRPMTRGVGFPDKTTVTSIGGDSLLEEEGLENVAIDFFVNTLGGDESTRYYKDNIPGTPIFVLRAHNPTRDNVNFMFTIADVNEVLRLFFDYDPKFNRLPKDIQQVLITYFEKRLDGNYRDFFEALFTPYGVLNSSTLAKRSELIARGNTTNNFDVSTRIMGTATNIGNYWSAYRNGTIMGWRLDMQKHSDGLFPCLSVVPTVGEPMRIVKRENGAPVKRGRSGAIKPDEPESVISRFYDGYLDFVLPSEYIGKRKKIETGEIKPARMPSRFIAAPSREDGALAEVEEDGIERVFFGAYAFFGKLQHSDGSQPPPFAQARDAVFDRRTYSLLQPRWHVGVLLAIHPLLRHTPSKALLSTALQYNDFNSNKVLVSGTFKESNKEGIVEPTR